MPREVIREEIDQRLRAEIAGYTFQDDGTQQADSVRKRYGIKIIGVGLGNIEVAGAKDEDRQKALEKPETKEVRAAQERVKQAEELRKEIITQRVMSWQAEWISESIRRRAQSEAEAAQEIGRARAQSQMRMIQALNEGFEQAKEAGLHVPTDMVVLLRLLDAMDEMAKEPGTREHVPPETLHTQAVLRHAAIQRAAAGH
jgi:molecular chaperone GrpE (heat shock protein)